MLLVETIQTCFVDTHAKNKNLLEVKHCSKGYLFWYKDFDSLDSFFHDV